MLPSVHKSMFVSPAALRAGNVDVHGCSDRKQPRLISGAYCASSETWGMYGVLSASLAAIENPKIERTTEIFQCYSTAYNYVDRPCYAHPKQSKLRSCQ